MLKQKSIFIMGLMTFLIADPPEWDFSPEEFEYAMHVTARVYENSTDIGSDGDLLGAFNEQEDCMGITEGMLVPPFLGDGHAFLIQIYSNSEDSESVSFQFYDDDEDTTYDIEEDLSFEANAVVGDLIEPTMFHILATTNNAPPVAVSTTYTLDEDNTIIVYLSATDEDGDALTFEIQDSPNNGTVALSGTAATYMPNANYNGVDNFSFTANDGQVYSNNATIDLIINAVNDAPYLFSIDDAEVNAGDFFVYEIQAVDVDGDDLTYTATVVNGEGTVTLSNNILTATGSVPNNTLEISIAVSDGVATDQTSFLLIILGNSCEDEYSQGFLAGSATGDVNGDGTLNIVDIVQSIDMILNGE